MKLSIRLSLQRKSKSSVMRLHTFHITNSKSDSEYPGNWHIKGKDCMTHNLIYLFKMWFSVTLEQIIIFKQSIELSISCSVSSQNLNSCNAGFNLLM